MESFMAVYGPKAGQYKSLGDFSGKPVFFTPAGFMNWLNFIRIFKALGYQFKHVQIGEAAQGDALQAGTIVGAVCYTTAGRSLPSYWRETELRLDIKIINPSQDEVKKLTAANLLRRDRCNEGIQQGCRRKDDPGVPSFSRTTCGGIWLRGRLQDVERSTISGNGS
jgi:TRAP-type uncharacterized transport system substrate-binding protein